MTDEVFWNKVDNEIIPLLRERKFKYLRFIEEKAQFIRTVSFDTSYELAYHEWMVFAGYMRELYYQAIVDKSMAQFCVMKCGRPADYVKF